MQARQALGEMASEGTLEDWVDGDALAHRIAASTVVISMEWSRSQAPGDVWHAGMIYASCAMLVGVSLGEAQPLFRKRMRAAQPLASTLTFSEQPGTADTDTAGVPAAASEPIAAPGLGSETP